MVLTFNAKLIREQIEHARVAPNHRELPANANGVGPSLHLTKKGERVYLVSSGLPEAKSLQAVEVDTGHRLRSVEQEKSAAPPVDIDDFVEAIPLDAFAKAITGGKSQLSIVVTRTYINVLGGQPERAPTRAGLSNHGRRVAGRG
jgi:hypothetical protein